jgi:hypothetical protein
MTLTGSWGGSRQWLYNNFETYLLICFGTVDQVWFNLLQLDDYFLSFSVLLPGLWCDSDQHPLNYSQKPQDALSHFIHLFSQPSKYILDAFTGTHSASLTAVLSSHNTITVEKDTKQWHYTSTNLHNQYQHATAGHTSTLQPPTSASPSSQHPLDSPPSSPEPFSSSQPNLDFNLLSVSLCPTCTKSVINTTEEIVQCNSPTCEQTFHSYCGIPQPNG